MHLVIAIPTLNRCKYLKNNIHFFDQQRRPANIRVSLAISKKVVCEGDAQEDVSGTKRKLESPEESPSSHARTDAAKQGVKRKHDGE